MTHRWKLSWPGNFCIDCGIDDPAEECLALNPDCKCMPGPDGKRTGECTAKIPPCSGHGIMSLDADKTVKVED